MQAPTSSVGVSLDWDEVKELAEHGRMDKVVDLFSEERKPGPVPLDDPIVGLPVVADGLFLWNAHHTATTKFLDKLYPEETDLHKDSEVSMRVCVWLTLQSCDRSRWCYHPRCHQRYIEFLGDKI